MKICLHPLNKRGYVTVHEDNVRVRKLICLVCRKQLELSKEKKRKIKKIINYILKLIGYLSFVGIILVFLFFIAYELFLEPKIKLNLLKQTCTEYYKFSGLKTYINDKICFVEVNNNKVELNDYLIYLDIKERINN